MNLLPFDELPVHSPRRLVDPDANLGVWDEIAPYFGQLKDQLNAAADVPALERWIEDWGELSALLDDEASRRYIAMTCHTDSPDAEKAYLDYVENIEPKLKPAQFELEKLYVKHPRRAGLSPDRYGVLDRDINTRVEVYREENVPLETDEARIGQQYQKLSGSLTVEFDGKEQTLAQMGRYLEEPDRSVREGAWRKVAERRLAEADRFEEQFESLLKLREQIAANAGFASYRDYIFKVRGRFDYTPADCESFHQAIESEVMPVLRELQRSRCRHLGLDALRPWDLSVDPLGRPPLRPFADTAALETKSHRIFERLDPRLAAGFDELRRLRLLDLDNRKGKAPGGYQTTLSEARLPFIFMNSVGLQRDVETLLHEAGHAFHTLAATDEPIYAYRSAPIEFCEVASMAMELLGHEFIDEFYKPDEARRARTTHLEGIIQVFPWIATVDAFQHWLYTHPAHSRTERTEAWLRLMDRFGGEVDWTGFENNRATLWHRQLHVFLYPFYYVEYGIAQLGALQVWVNGKQDRARALADYRRGLALGGSRPLPELFSAAGCRFDFSADAVRPLIERVAAELKELAG